MAVTNKGPSRRLGARDFRIKSAIVSCLSVDGAGVEVAEISKAKAGEGEAGSGGGVTSELGRGVVIRDGKDESGLEMSNDSARVPNI